MVCPVIYEESSEARNTAMPVSSSVVPGRLSRIFLNISEELTFAISSFVISVEMIPGAILLQVILFGVPIRAIQWPNAIIPAFDTA